MPDLYKALAEAVAQLVAEAKKRAADGVVSFEDMWALVLMAIQVLVRLAETYSGYDGAAKKAAVMGALTSFYDQVIVPLPLPGVPRFLESFVDSFLKSTMLKLAGAAIDAAVDLLNRTGWAAVPDAGTSIDVALASAPAITFAVPELPTAAAAVAAAAACCPQGGCSKPC